MYYPSFIRDNMRYRGPMESRKMNRIQQALVRDIGLLFTRMNDMHTETLTLREEAFQGNRDIAGSLQKISSEGKYVKGGESRV
jgi:hypothetical protein